MLVDMDGVIWRGKNVIHENVSAVKYFIEQGFKVVFFTNNSSKSRIEYLNRLRAIGINVGYDDVLTSGFLASELISSKNINTAFVIGEYGLVEELVKNGVHIVVDVEYVDSVVVGLDRFLTYNKLSKATHYIRSGALFVATNTDATYPSEKGEEPGAGSIVSALVTSTGRKPDYVTGKPNPIVIDYVLRKYRCRKSDVLIVGDRLDTDILLGLNTGVDTALVLTGVTRPGDKRIDEYKPTYVVNTLSELVKKIT